MTQQYATQTVHGGEARRKPYASATTPVVQTSTYTFADSAEIQQFMESKANGERGTREEYGRYGNPTQRAAERKLALLEGGERALLFASGMNALTTTMLTLLSHGDHVVMAQETYKRTREFAASYLRRWGIEVTCAPIGDLASWAQALRPTTRLLFCETPTNPTLRVMDLARLAALGRASNVLTLVDSTFATPLNLRPLALGIDLVVHSATKYLGGHNDLLAGVVVGRGALLAPIEDARGVLGGVSNPNDAYLLIRGLKTLALRVRQQNESALRLARFLAGRPEITCVHYPGLPSHPDHALAQAQMSGFGGVVSFEITGDMDTTARFVDALRIPYIGPTLGGVESMVQQPAALLSLDPGERRAAGIPDTLVRYAVGIEDPDDLIADVAQALERMRSGEWRMGNGK
ncbi:MAG: aminotransferase class I/II-fold pyridoxal phosphate-dependent enzyme [Anaerolineae bacterium]|nr:aminotransferase class I/II-fold pyridoxal phosphate-dependent enzyme [Anaerolineae bacterium]